MKKILIALSVCAFFVACNSASTTETSKDSTSTSTMSTTDTSKMAPAMTDTSMMKDSTHMMTDTTKK